MKRLTIFYLFSPFRPANIALVNSHAHPRAFTLLELLVVIAIICILAALLLPGIGAARRQVNDSKCVSNLRQLGVAIAAFASDHNTFLPGPCPAGVGTTLSTSNKNELINYLQPYLGLPAPTKTAYYPEILHCPAADPFAAQQGKKWYNFTLMDAYSNTDIPAGKRYMTGSILGASAATPVVPPLRLTSISAAINQSVKDASGNSGSPSEIPVLREIDATLKTWPWPVAPTPLHGDHENALFLDLHVGRLNPADYKMAN